MTVRNGLEYYYCSVPKLYRRYLNHLFFHLNLILIENGTFRIKRFIMQSWNTSN